MNSTSKEQREHSRRLMNLSSIPFVLLIAYWGLTWYWGTTEVQQDYVKLNRTFVPPHYKIYVDRRPQNVNSVWTLIAYPSSPFPGIVSLEVDMGVSCIWGGPRREYFFWCPGYHTKVPFWAREVTGTYEDTD
ncbi:hypothetical protein [Gimesia panareensis]|uniref:Uncharacterized protein n=1 Tax=Gimesia panareensis TaxID=2527978 RepID=A0A518FQ95_9PLAN|nr:hypothetical protein [Gimesia panareensis]QDU48423.1 hypothetical protein Pan110_07370 [Gimesia panareensis]QDV18455.1 hypothetical protein Pan153_31130 [Gimesia panareensis]